MDVHQFITKWQRSTLRERQGSPEHFIDVCHLVGHPTPAEIDPSGHDFSADRTMTLANGDKAFADYWYRGHFAWEYKGSHRDLDAAYEQLRKYREALESPPLLIVSDMQLIRVHTNFTGTPTEIHDIELTQLRESSKLEDLRSIFFQPDRFKPGTKVEKVTEDVASDFAEIAVRLEARGYPALDVAHFLMQSLFCMFTEDIGLLPNENFRKTVKRGCQAPSRFPAKARELFDAMRDGGEFHWDDIPHFNGGLFEQIWIPELNRGELQLLLAATQRDWSQIEPAIFGVLFERSLNPEQRAKLGQFYTGRHDIERVVDAVVMKPLRRRWEDIKVQADPLKLRWARALEAREKARRQRIPTRRPPQRADRPLPEQQEFEKLLRGFQGYLAALSILDPACGSGNFLYVAMARIKDLEKEVSAFGAENGLPMVLPQLQVRPSQFHGLEINPYAQELTKVVLWIGYLQWLHANGFKPAREPYLEDGEHVQRRDSLVEIGNDGRVTEMIWPEADFIIGNPPFIGGKYMRRYLGDEYVDNLFHAFRGQVRPEADFCCYFFEQARKHIESNPETRVGLLATSSIRGGANRSTLQRIKESGDIFLAWSDEPWILDGASVNISIVGFDGGIEEERQLNGAPVGQIHADLSGTVDITRAVRLAENADIAFMGDTKGGPFEIPHNVAESWLCHPLNPNGRPNGDVVVPWINGLDLTRRNRDMWIVDFGVDMPESEAAFYEMPFEHIRREVKPMRDSNRRKKYRDHWWLHVEPRPGMRSALTGLERYICTPTIAKHRLFAWFESPTLPDHQLIVFARDDDFSFGILHSRAHEVWSLRLGTSLENRPRYTPTTCFETFPFPRPTYEQRDGISTAAENLNCARENWLNPKGANEAELKKRTLTNLYNARPTWLDQAHQMLDRAVWAAYGWKEDPADTDDETILRRLLSLNLERSQNEVS